MPVKNSSRSVARPVSNLGNTCYMNAVLQALSHAPELCLAMDCQPHHLTCPVAAENKRLREESPKPDRSDSNNNSNDSITPPTTDRKATRKSSRRTGRKSPGDADSATSSTEPQFCALCELEHHVAQVHNASTDKPVAPTTFVHGFIDRVAPWFQLGVQEDSHEFLRLLIDAMQKSCQKARAVNGMQDNPQDDSAIPNQGSDEDRHSRDSEYPFSLFRGTVESNVVCESCKASSSTLDPIEDVGLEVAVPHTSNATLSSTKSNSRHSSRNTSPIPTLTDVKTAFGRFARPEALDSGYTCEKCGKVGRATKQSRLHKIPPVLTLHLKRFRYGDRQLIQAPQAPQRRSQRSEVSQLLGNDAGVGASGKSGSAKIEGHVKFDMFFDLKPYLTEELKAKHKNMFCRLFAVIVHAGKNSHSGHYISFVRNVSKNEWWKMDDSRITCVKVEEVMQAEAYMLFYRVVQHPVSEELVREHQLQVQKQEDENAASVKHEENLTEASLAKAESSAKSRKRPPIELYEDGLDWARKTNFPPHLMGLIEKVSEMIADDVHISAQYHQQLKKMTKSDWAGPPVGEHDVVGGTEKYTRVLLDLFYRLRDSWKVNNISAATSDSKSKQHQTQRSAVEAPEPDVACDDPVGLL